MKYNVTNLPPNKLTPNEMGFLKTIGWEITKWYQMEGQEVEITQLDNYTFKLSDSRYNKNTSYIKNWLN